jgi:nucleotide-binding universal stress UspA family protein
MYKHILIPTDGSAASQRAAAHAVALAAAVGAKVTALFVAPPATPVVYQRYLPVKLMSAEAHAEAIRRASEANLAKVARAAEAAGVACESISVTGDFPAEAIVEIARKKRCDLVVMASHVRAGMPGVLLGSQTQKVLAQAKMPVLVWR